MRAGPGEFPWAVTITNAHDSVLASGVLLDERLVLTCAHVVAPTAARDDNPPRHAVTVHFGGLTRNRPSERTARVTGEAHWVPEDPLDGSGDIAVLTLDEALTTLPPGPAPLRRLGVLLDVPVRGHGRSDHVLRLGPWVDAETKGAGGPSGELRQLNPASPGSPWFVEGYSGAGILDRDGYVVGILLSVFRGEAGRGAAYMIPVETLISRLPWIARRVSGTPPIDPDISSPDPARMVDTGSSRDIADWLRNAAPGDVKLVEEDQESLAATVVLTDPERRADLEAVRRQSTSAAPLGSVQVAIDVTDRATDYVAGELEDQLAIGLTRGRPATAPPTLRRSVRRPNTLVLTGVDRASSPAELIDTVIEPLIAYGGTLCLRLLIGVSAFDTDAAARVRDALQRRDEAVPERVAELGAKHVELQVDEREVANREKRFKGCGVMAPTDLSELLTVMGESPRSWAARKLGMVQCRLHTKVAMVTRRRHAVAAKEAALEDARGLLDLTRQRALVVAPGEDKGLDRLYATACAALWDEPYDLVEGTAAVNAYVGAVSDRERDGGTRS